VSIDGFDAATHDAIRGEGSFERAIEGVQRLLALGFLPIVTAGRTWPEGEEPGVYRGFVRMLQRRGYPRPRVKLMPALKIGAEAERDRGYRRSERVTRAMVADEEFDLSQLVCASARVVTDRGIWVCPILLEEPDGNLGEDLEKAADTPYRLRHSACYTCWRYGAICSNPGGAAPEAGAASEELVSP
ncbi:MAG: radical SAM protein, partial [Gemmatimonadota bacterium]|nr:radical SAM protein [Gemmatimonadota bacterium]